MTQAEKTQIEERIVDVLKTVYDPEIPVNIYDLGMIYKIDVKDDFTVDLDMKPGIRTRMGSIHDERRSKSRTWIRLI